MVVIHHRVLTHWPLHDLINMQRCINRMKCCLKNIIIYSSNIIILFDNTINDDLLLWLLPAMGTVEEEAMVSVPSANSSSKQTELSSHPSIFYTCRIFSYSIWKRYSSMFITMAVVMIIVEYMVCLVVDWRVKYASLPLKLELWQNDAVNYFSPTPLNGTLPRDLLFIFVVSRVS